MRPRQLLLIVGVLGWGLGSSLGSGASAWAASPPGGASTADPTRAHWSEAKSLIAKGAYREALQELSIILTLTPNDPWAVTYKALCDRRLSSEQTFVPMSPTQLFSLEETLRREEAAQRQAAIQQKALERQVQQEQAKWDRDVKGLMADTIKVRKAKEKAEQQATARRHRELEARQRRIEQQLATAQRATKAPPPAPTTPPAAAPSPVMPLPSPAPPVPVPARSPEAPPAAASAPQPSPSAPSASPKTEAQLPAAAVTAPPVPVASPSQSSMTVPMESPGPVAPSQAPTPMPTKPRPQPAPLGPRAVQIFGDQMNVSPERHLALAEGNVRVVFPAGTLTCDQLTFFTDTKDVYARGHVRLEREAELIRGEMVHYNVNTKKGRVLQGTVHNAPWYEYGRVMEHIAEGVTRVKPGYVTSCEFEPPHFRFQGRRSIVFAQDKILRSRHVTLVADQLPLLYFPWLSIAERQTPFFLIPGKNKVWQQFALMGYRYEWPAGHRGTLRLDWRRNMGWGTGLDHWFNSSQFGKGVLKVYYNDEPNISRPKTDWPKGASINRYRFLWRHMWQPTPETSLVTDIQKFSDVDFRREFLFREEYVHEVIPGSDANVSDMFISTVLGDPNYSLSATLTKRVNRFSTVTEAFPDAKFDIRTQPIGDSQFFIESRLNVANLQTRRAHSEDDTDAVRVDWFQQVSEAFNWFRPILLTPKVGVRQTYYNKDIQGGAERPQGKRNLISGQFSMGLDSSLTLFRVFPVTTNWLGLDINLLRHVLAPNIAYAYVHRPTVPSALLNFSTAEGASNRVSFGLDNTLQTKRGSGGALRSVDLVRLGTAVPYTFRGTGNKQGGRLGDVSFDLELYPWSWLRVESDWKYPTHFLKGSRDERVTAWNVDLIMVGGRPTADAHTAQPIVAPTQFTSTKTVDRPEERPFQQGPQIDKPLLPVGQWYCGVGHRYSYNDKTESVMQLDWRPSEKWQIGTFHRLTWKEVARGSKRFNNMREWQYTLTRDLHDWLAEVTYRVDRELGEELFFIMTLKAYPERPIDYSESYHQPKVGSQDSPFSPVPRR